MIRYICTVTLSIVMCAIAYADDATLGKDDFVSSSIGAIFDKVGKYTSGEKKIFDDDQKDQPQGMDYEMDALGNKIPDKVVDAEEAAATGKPIFAKKGE